MSLIKQITMTYFTSWDVNTFLSLVTWGLPEEVVKGMMKMTKKVHQEITLGEALGYWTINSPWLVRLRDRQPQERRGMGLKFKISDILKFPQTRLDVFKRRINLTKEFKREWRLRSIEERQKKVADWCKFGNEEEKLRHQGRLRIVKHSNLYNNDYTKNLWRSWEAGASSYYFVGWDRRDNISKWYEGIHPGRFFLFYKENKIIQERNRGVPKGPCEDGYVYPKTPIFDWGPYEQLIEDLRCIDGPGIGEKAGSTVEHIDDLFSK